MGSLVPEKDQWILYLLLAALMIPGAIIQFVAKWKSSDPVWGLFAALQLLFGLQLLLQAKKAYTEARPKKDWRSKIMVHDPEEGD